MALNPKEAPSGFYAVPKEAVSHDLGNLCRQCDWRHQCNDHAIDKLAYGHRCMGYPIVATRDGKTYQRQDQTSVLFKRRVTEDSSDTPATEQSSAVPSDDSTQGLSLWDHNRSYIEACRKGAKHEASDTFRSK